MNIKNNEYLLHLKTLMIADYNRFMPDREDSVQCQMCDEYAMGITFNEGSKYIKIKTNTSVWGFIVKTDKDAKFSKGDILKAADRNTPTRNFARGNIYDIDTLKTIRWTGA